MGFEHLDVVAASSELMMLVATTSWRVRSQAVFSAQPNPHEGKSCVHSYAKPFPTYVITLGGDTLLNNRVITNGLIEPLFKPE